MAQRRSPRSFPSYKAVSTRQRMETTHREIVAAAVHVFRVRGYAATRMTTIAATAGVSPRTLYRYFDSKSELLAATVDESIERLLKEISGRVRVFPLKDAIVDAVRRADIELDDGSREIMRVAAADPKVWRHFLEATNRAQSILAIVLRTTAEPEHHAVEPSAEELLLWDVRAGALVAAVTAADRRWATMPESDLSALTETAVEAVLPIVAPW
jgi:AcrR family transcriptional regulator